jgi:hypothetical protein
VEEELLVEVLLVAVLEQLIKAIEAVITMDQVLVAVAVLALREQTLPTHLDLLVELGYLLR